ncbi:MAG: V-type ATP synthase subunit E [Elusimicrobia bacterium]|nr:V-type ATP synthase subunit E [Elusimicrobiota bacterium]
MEIQLQELIDKIKKDGIEATSAETAKLKSDAEAEAAKIIAAAQKEAESIVAKGKADAERLEKAGIAAIQQASRNLILAFKAEIQTLLDKIISQSSATAYGEDTLKTVLPEILKNWAAGSGADSLNVLLSEKELKKLESWFNTKLTAELKKGVELKPVRNLDSGFRIAEKDGSAYYDFSAQAITQLLSAYLTPRLAEIIKTQDKGM